MRTLLYAVACVAIPSVWGVGMYYAFGWWQKRRTLSRVDGRQIDEREVPSIDYYI